MRHKLDEWWLEWKVAMTFYTRLPLPMPAAKKPVALAQAAWAFSLVGALVGGVSAAVYALLALCHVPVGVAAWLTLAVQIGLTGALHEDGLADSADGLGAGGDAQRRLAIMKDSRIGSYGALALLVALMLRAQALAALQNPWQVAVALVVAGAVSRALMGGVMYYLSPVKSAGLAANAGMVSGAGAACGAGFALLIALLLLGKATWILLLLVPFLAYWLRVIHRTIGGTAGDLLGATQQISEVLILVLLATFAAAGNA